MDKEPQLQDLRLFCLVVRRGSFIGAAREGRSSPNLVSKRVALLEKALGVQLLSRTTRKVSVTDEGQKVFGWAQRILEDVESMRGELRNDAIEPQGPLRVASSAKLGREIVAPVLSRMKSRFPGIEVWLEVMDRRVDLLGEGFHVDIRAGEVEEASLIAHPVADSSRILCAAPAYLQRYGMPRTLAELRDHDCVLLRERAEPFGIWRLLGPKGQENVKVSGSLASNDIDIVMRWAHDGYGIVMSADWLFRESLENGNLVRVLPEWRQPARVNAVTSTRSAQSAKVRIFLEYLREAIPPQFTLTSAQSHAAAGF